MNKNKIMLADALLAINHMNHIYEAVGRIYKNDGLPVLSREVIAVTMIDLHGVLLEVVNDCLRIENAYPAFFDASWDEEENSSDEV